MPKYEKLITKIALSYQTIIAPIYFCHECQSELLYYNFKNSFYLLLDLPLIRLNPSLTKS